MSLLTDIRALSAQLLPTGRAFKGPVGGWMKALIAALSISEASAYQDALSIYDSILPDRYDPSLPDSLQVFTGQDCTDWETRLGLAVYDPNGPNIPGYIPNLQTRYMAILRKINYPGRFQSRTNYQNIQGQLQAAGFNVYVYENRFFIGGQWVTVNPASIGLGTDVSILQYGQRQYGQRQYGGIWDNLVVNYLRVSDDQLFNTSSDLSATFFIGGPDLSTPATAYANVPLARQAEFRQLILKLKPCSTVAYLFISYV